MDSRACLDGNGGMRVGRQTACQQVVDVQQEQTTRDHVVMYVYGPLAPASTSLSRRISHYHPTIIMPSWTLQQVAEHNSPELALQLF